MIDKTIDLSVSNYGTASQLEYSMAILPWGATEPHNQHLPYLTDAILSHDVAVDAAQIAFKQFCIRAMVLPAIPLGAQNPGQRDLKFCIHYHHSTQYAVLTDIVASLYHQGIHRLLIVNGHGGNSFKSMIRDLAVDYPDMLIASSEWFKVCPAKEFFDQPGDHADELESSVMMHYHPELVNINEAGPGKSASWASEQLQQGVAWIPRKWTSVSRDTGIGNPTLATAEKGKKFTLAVAQRYALLIRDLCTLPSLYTPIPD